jgi:hypothetical protein
MAVDAPTRGLMGMGLSKGSARSLSQLLQGQVASGICSELPDVEYSAAPGALIIARPGLMHFIPKATQVLLDLGLGSVDPAMLAASLCPVGYLDPVIHELLTRAKANPARNDRFASALSRRPAPSGHLQSFRRRVATDVPAGNIGAPPIDASTGGFVADQIRHAIKETIQDRTTHARAREWAGWALLAAMWQFDLYNSEIPVPSRRGVHPLDPLSSQRVYRASLMLLIAGALNLIDETEGS